MDTKEKIEVMQAFINGEKIQLKEWNAMHHWEDCPLPNWNWEYFDFRIKPKELEEPEEPKGLPEWLTEFNCPNCSAKIKITHGVFTINYEI